MWVSFRVLIKWDSYFVKLKIITLEVHHVHIMTHTKCNQMPKKEGGGGGGDKENSPVGCPYRSRGGKNHDACRST